MARIISQNVKGIQNVIKRRGLFKYLCEKADIVCIQETHCDDKIKHIWATEWSGFTVWSNFSSNARGSAILVRKGAEIQIVESFLDNNGRLTGLVFQLREKQFVLLNVYALNNDAPEYWLEVLKCFEKFEGERILVGDFNLALNVELDRSNRLSKNNEKSAEIINNYMQDSFLLDVWRDRNPDVKMYTFCRKKPVFTGSRLDYILTDASITSWIEKVEIIPGFRFGC